MLEVGLFSAAFLSAATILILCLYSLRSEQFQFFPPPEKASWQHWTFKLLFRGFFYPLLILSALSLHLPNDIYSLAVSGLGMIFFIAGFGLAFKITFTMGWRNAFGEKHGLQTTGWFSRSRNPVYVATMVAMIGWGLVANSLYVAILLALWAIMYLLAPLLEEPWLEDQYGEAYKTYKSQVPRFI